ncbi:MAG: hypothetical protein ABW321_15320, partial [Polyangiales bacterium]
MTLLAAAAVACSNPGSPDSDVAPGNTNVTPPSGGANTPAVPASAGAPAAVPAVTPTPAAQAGTPAAAPVPAGTSSGTSPQATGPTSSHEFRTEPVMEGYQRFEPPAIELKPGDSDDWAQWIGGPLDQDYDVVDIRGVQSIGGHHALVYAT